MKSKCVLVRLAFGLIISTGCFAQNESLSFIPSVHLNITDNKTTNLIFPFPVQSIDRGSRDILVQQPKGTENIVQVKANEPGFVQTNLSVITIDGKLYSFTVDYSLQPAQLNFIIQKNKADNSDSLFKEIVQLSSANNEALLQSVAQKIITTKERRVRRNKRDHIELRLNGIYINHDVLFFRLELINNSPIGYDLDGIRFLIKDRQQSKRTATQEDALAPIYKFGNTENVAADSASSAIIALPKFTLPDSKYLSIQVSEKNGGRNLNLVLYNSQIMKAVIIKD